MVKWESGATGEMWTGVRVYFDNNSAATLMEFVGIKFEISPERNG